MTLAVIIWGIVRALLTVLVGVFAVHRLHLLWRLVRHRGRRPLAPSLANDALPTVTVQLPLYNERFVAARLLDAVGQLDYPRERLQVQVLDDSDDSTATVVDETVERLRNGGLDIEVLRRGGEREEFKAGAMAHGLRRASGELVAVFDADFVPDPGFLRRLVPHFTGRENGGVGMVQARWGFLNADANWLTRVQAWLLDAHFRVEHLARWRSGCCFNFNGTAGIWRRECIDAAGGWEGDTLTEDLDLSYRAQRLGWRFVYVDDEVAPSELPESWSAFRAQQFRWAKGATQTARKVLPQLWDRGSRLSLAARLEATFHLTANLGYLLFGGLLLGGILVALGVAAFGAGALPVADVESWGWLRAAGLAAMIVALLFFAAPASMRKGARPARGWRDWLALGLTVPVAIALAVNNGLAVIEGLAGRISPFERTPKFGDSKMDRRRSPYRAGHGLGISLVEMILGAGFAVLAARAVALESWLDLSLALPAAIGFAWSGAASLVARGRWRPVRTRPAGERGRYSDDAGGKTVDIGASTP